MPMCMFEKKNGLLWAAHIDFILSFLKSFIPWKIDLFQKILLTSLPSSRGPSNNFSFPGFFFYLLHLRVPQQGQTIFEGAFLILCPFIESYIFVRKVDVGIKLIKTSEVKKI